MSRLHSTLHMKLGLGHITVWVSLVFVCTYEYIGMLYTLLN